MLEDCTGGVEFGGGSVPDCSEGSARAAGGLRVRLRDLECCSMFMLERSSWSLTRPSYDDPCPFTVVLLRATCHSGLSS